MNTRLGKSFGLAFVVAVGILALMFALGTFNAQKAGADDHGDVSLSLNTTKASETGTPQPVEATVTVDIPNLRPGASITIDLPGLTVVSGVTARIEGGMTWPAGDASKGVTLDSVAATGVVTIASVTSTAADPGATPPTSGQVVIIVPDDTDNAVGAADPDGDGPIGTIEQGLLAGTVTIILSSTTGATQLSNPTTPMNVTAKVTTDGIPTDDNALAASVKSVDLGTSAAVVAGTNFNINPNTPVAGSAVEIELTADFPDGVIGFGSFDIILEKFGIPSDIDPKHVLIRTNEDASDTNVAAGNPVDVSVSNSVISIELNENVDDGTVQIGSGTAGNNIIIVLRKRAGITAPTLTGKYDVTIDGTTDEELVTVVSSLSVSPKSGVEDAELTVSGAGYTDGTATIYHFEASTTAPASGSSEDVSPTGFNKIGSATASGGEFETTVTASDKFVAGEDNRIIARSANRKMGAGG